MRNQVVIITGASSGIGAALAHELGKLGAKLVLAARDESKLQAIALQYPDSLVVQTDVTDETQCKNLIDKTIEKFGKIDVLVNNAGISMSVMFEDIKDLSLFRKIMDVNYFGTVYCTYYALPHIKKSQGQLVAVSSVTGKNGVPTRTAYAASKHAMQGFFDSLRVELMGTDVNVLVISPGYVQSEVRIRALGSDAEAIGKSHIDESSAMTAEACAKEMVEAIQGRKRDVIIASPRTKLLPYMKLIAPAYIDKVARQAVDSGKT